MLNIYDFTEKIVENLVDAKSGALRDQTMKHVLHNDSAHQYKFVHVLTEK